MKFWSVLKWMFLIASAVVIALGAGGAWIWKNGDRLIREQAFRTFDQAAPDLELRIDGIELLSTSSLRVTGLEIRDRVADRVILRAGEATATIDEAQLMDHQNVIVRSVKVSKTEVLLIRSETGRWNWQNYKFRQISDNPLIPPSVILEDVRAQIQLEHGEGIPAANLIVTSPSFQAIPKSAEAYDFLGSLALPGAGNLALNGACNLASKNWMLSGKLNGVTADQSLMELAKSTAPQLAEKLQHLDAKIATVLPTPVASRTASVNPETNAIVVGGSHVSPRFLGVLDVDFLIEKRTEKDIPDLRLKVEVRDGQLSSPAIPVRLSDVRARFYWDNNVVDLKLLNARDGDALVTGQFAMDLRENAPPATATVHLEKFPITKQLQPLLPVKSQKIFDHFEPTGTVSGDIAIQRFPSGKWLPTAIDGVGENATLRYHKFRYPVTGVSATLHQRPLPPNADSMDAVICDVVANGMVGNRPVASSGWLRNPGPQMELDYHVDVQDLPLDSKFRDSLEEAGRRVIEAFSPECRPMTRPERIWSSQSWTVSSHARSPVTASTCTSTDTAVIHSPCSAPITST